MRAFNSTVYWFLHWQHFRQDKIGRLRKTWRNLSTRTNNKFIHFSRAFLRINSKTLNNFGFKFESYRIKTKIYKWVFPFSSRLFQNIIFCSADSLVLISIFNERNEVFPNEKFPSQFFMKIDKYPFFISPWLVEIEKPEFSEKLIRFLFRFPFIHFPVNGKKNTFPDFPTNRIKFISFQHVQLIKFSWKFLSY